MLARNSDQRTSFLSTFVTTQTFATTHWRLPWVQLCGLRIINCHHCECAFDFTVVAGPAIMQMLTRKPTMGA
jgi:hypothetical protein